MVIAEDQWFDRKSARIDPKDLADDLIGMANADGGRLVIGLWKGEVEGTDDPPQRRNRQVQAPVDLCVPPVRATTSLVPCVNSKGRPDHLLVFDVTPGEVVHSNRRDDVFLRVGDSNRKLTFSQRQELFYDKGQATYEATPIEGTSIDDLDADVLGGYAVALGHPDPARLLVARGLATAAGELTIAGCLLFGLAPQATLPEAYVRVLRYRGIERGSGARQQIIRDQRFEGPIPDQLLAARQAIKELEPRRRALVRTGRFAP